MDWNPRLLLILAPNRDCLLSLKAVLRSTTEKQGPIALLQGQLRLAHQGPKLGLRPRTLQRPRRRVDLQPLQVALLKMSILERLCDYKVWKRMKMSAMMLQQSKEGSSVRMLRTYHLG